MTLTSPLLGERAVRRGDEVITVAAGFPTTVTPIIQFGAVPVFIDVTIPQYNIDVTKLEEALSGKTKAVMIAHTLGNPFDIKAVKDFCDKHEGRAIRVGWPGPYQVFTMMYPAEKFYEMMMEEPELTKAMLNKYCDISLEMYERMFQAAGDRIDLLRVCDDYGTQRGCLFSPKMFNEFFAENTKRFVDLAHKHNCFYLQHSCGAIRNIIPNLIECGVDIIEPIQKVTGMEVDGLKKDFGDKLTFQGGVCTQTVLPHGTPEEVRAETVRVIKALHKDGGYILAPSQDFEGDVPVENILALYDARKDFM